jgi:replicative DNA helicase
VSNPNGDLRHLFDAETEELILGAILTQGDTVLEHTRRLTVDDFTAGPHRKIFAAVSYLDGEIEIGIASVAHRLDEVGELDSVGGISKLVDRARTGFVGSIKREPSRQ